MNVSRLARGLVFVAASASLLLAGSASAGPYSAVYVFGDSVSDSGNVALAIGQPSGVPQSITGNGYIPDFPYFPSGRFSNGPVWVESFAAGLGLSAAPSLAGGTDFAFAGARTGGPNVPVPTLTTQAGMFLGATGGVAPGNALYVIAEVGNDARDTLQAMAISADPLQTLSAGAAAYAANIEAIVHSLRNAGAQHFLVFNNVDLGLVPAIQAIGGPVPGLASLVSATMNSALEAALVDEPDVTPFDTFGFLDDVVNHPASFGFDNVADACGAAAGADCSRYAFWDGLHPTAAMHGLIARTALAAVVPEPAGLLLVLGGLAAMVAFSRRVRS